MLGWREARHVDLDLRILALGGALLTVAGFGLGWFAFTALPLSMGVGILKYRLYDIDRIISRTPAGHPDLSPARTHTREAFGP